MRLSLRFVIPLLLVLTAFAWGSVPLVDALMQRWFVRDLDMRSSLIATTVEEPLAELIDTNSTTRIDRLSQSPDPGRTTLCGRALPARAGRCDRHLHLPARNPLRGADGAARRAASAC